MKKIFMMILFMCILLVSCGQKTGQNEINSNNNLQGNDEGFIEPGTSGVFLSDPSMIIEDGVSDEDSSVSDKNPFNL